MPQSIQAFDAWQIAQANLDEAVRTERALSTASERNELPTPGNIDNLRLVASARLRLFMLSADARESSQ